jgi:glycosyltransferase involved in cell wall biosynthesis
MQITILTATFNSAENISKCLESIWGQSHTNIEHLIMDGNSQDETLAIVSKYPQSKVVSRQDSGLYDALNKGFQIANGEIIGFLHSDDQFQNPDVLKKISTFFESNPDVDAICADSIFIDATGKINRHCSSKKFQITDFKYGKMIAHTSFFARKKIYREFPFNTKYRLASDFDQILRIYQSNKFAIQYIPIITTKMLVGGMSNANYKARIKSNKEIYESCKINNIKTNYLLIYSKYFSKIFEYL